MTFRRPGRERGGMRMERDVSRTSTGGGGGGPGSGGPPGGGGGGGGPPGGEPGVETRRSRYPDSHQVFVGNLPHNLSDAELRSFFASKSFNHATALKNRTFEALPL